MSRSASVHLDALRGAAALVVFAAHTRVLFFGGAASVVRNGPIRAGGWVLPNYLALSLGHQAVIVFFVLSGLLVGGSVLRQFAGGAFNWVDYLSARLTRLWVPLLPLLVIGGLLDLAAIHFFPGASTGYAARRLGAEIFFGNVGFLQGIAVPYLGFNVPLWSLAFEWWFYVAFPLLLIAGRLQAKSVGAGVILAALYIMVGPVIAFYFVLWCLGAAVAILPRRKLPAFVLPIAAGAFVVLNLVVRKLHLFPLAGDATLAAGAAGLCYVILHSAAPAGRLYTTAARFLARVSYTLYLAHFPIIFLLAQWLSVSLRPWPLDALHGAAVAALLSAVFAVCWLLYLTFEARTDAVRALLCKAKMEKAPGGRLTSPVNQ